jgi:hypothetical protein
MEKKQLATIAENVSAFLPGWRFDATRGKDQSIELIGPNRARLFFGRGSHNENNKFFVTGVYPNKYNQNSVAHGRANDYDCVKGKEVARAGLSRDRSPKSLAADIKRRVIISYLPNFKAAWIEREAYQAKLNILIWRANAAGAALPGLVNDHGRKNNFRDYTHRINANRYSGYQSEKTNVKAEINSHTKNDFNLHLAGVPDDLAFKILGLINQHEQQGK